MLLHSYLTLLFVLFLCEVNSSFNQYPTYKNVGSQSVNGTTVSISDDESMIAAGFIDGTFKIFDIQVNQLCSNISTQNSSIVGGVWMPSFGPITADSSGRVVIWSTTCQVTNQATFTDPILGIGYFQSNAAGIIALNFGSYIQEYNAANFTELTKYDSNGNETFLDFLFYNDGTSDMLIASNSELQIRVMDMIDGSQISNFDVASSITMMTSIQSSSGNQILGLGEDANIYRFTSDGSPFDLGTFTTANSMTFCPSTKEFSLAKTSVQNIGIYLYSGDQQNSLINLQGLPQSIDCSTSYLVSIDDPGYINVYTYESFKTWIVGLIVGIAAGLVLLVVGVIIFIRMRRKWARQAQQQKNYSNKPKKYPRKLNENASKIDSMNMLQNITLQTTMRQ